MGSKSGDRYHYVGGDRESGSCSQVLSVRSWGFSVQREGFGLHGNAILDILAPVKLFANKKTRVFLVLKSMANVSF